MKVTKHPHRMQRHSKVVTGHIHSFGYGGGREDEMVKFSVDGETHQFEFYFDEKEWDDLVETIKGMR